MPPRFIGQAWNVASPIPRLRHGSGASVDTETGTTAVNSLVGVDARTVFAATTEIAPGVFAGTLGGRATGLPVVALKPDPTNPALDTAGPGASATDQRGQGRVEVMPGEAVADRGAAELVPTGALRANGGPGDDQIGGSDLRDSLSGGAATTRCAATAATTRWMAGRGAT